MRMTSICRIGVALATVCAAAGATSARAAACDGFTDVDSGSSFCAAVTYLKDHGITLGCTGTTYCPNDFVTRLQMAAFMQRAGQADPSNTLGTASSTIGGGMSNSTGDADSTVSGGAVNSATGRGATVSGGEHGTASADNATVSGGEMNTASGLRSIVAGGFNSTASGAQSAVLGGDNNIAAGDSSVVLGHQGVTTSLGTGSFVFSDLTDRSDHANFGAGLDNIFIAAAHNGFYLYTTKEDTPVGCKIPPAGGTWECTSAKDVKRDFEDIDREDILARVVALPVQRWRYQDEGKDIRHIGTFAGDFRAAFGLGSDDRTISMADADGVALAAIQGLNAKVEARDAMIAAQARELALLAARLAELEHSWRGAVAH